MAAQRAFEVDEMSPEEAFETLKADADTALIDVRTRAEWAFVGLPDLTDQGRQVMTIEWVRFPDMSPNPDFADQLYQAANGKVPGRLLFICRSGARSMAAARLMAQVSAAAGAPVRCTNVAEGFEGDLDGEGHRGAVNGWKVRGLPWRQN